MPAPALSAERFFTVRDSIEMARFDRENPKIVFSPDKKHFAVVTSRGIVRSNTVESTMWLFESNLVGAFLRADSAPAPIPKAVVRWQTVPQVFSLDSYEPVISDLQWLPDSKRLLYLAQNRHGERQLRIVDLSSGLIHDLTLPGYDVRHFVWTPRAIIYQATPSHQDIPVGNRINADAFDITGQLIECVLFAQQDCGGSKHDYLWIAENAKTVRVVTSKTLGALRFLSYGDSPISVSPDSRWAVVLPLVVSIPKTWRYYKTHLLEATTLSEYTIVNLVDGSAVKIVDAPVNPMSFLRDAIWSRNGNRVILMNTFLSLDVKDATERVRRLTPCSAAVVEVKSNLSKCIRFGSDDWYGNGSNGGLWLTGASFGGTDDYVTLHFQTSAGAKKLAQRYHYESGNWKAIASGIEIPDTNTGASQPFSVAVRQDLNTSPALWVTDHIAKKTKKIFEPNPQLAQRQLGEASIFQWTDKTGYQWTAGLVKPPTYLVGKRYPLVIQTHGFNSSEFLTDGSFAAPFAARPLASAGMLVLQVGTNHRHGLTANEALDQVRGYESVIDLLTAEGMVDPKKIGIIGFSRTCYYVESALIKDPNLFAAASITDGVDLSYMQYRYAVGDTEYTDEYNKIYGEAPFGAGITTWLKTAPGFNLDRVETPLRIEAISPSSVLAEWEIYSSLQMRRRPVAFEYIPDGQHLLQKPLDRMASQQGTVDWFRFWLQGYEDPNPAKASQYARWRALRTLETSRLDSASLSPR